MMPLIFATILSLVLTLCAPLRLAAEDVDMVLVKNASAERANIPERYTVQPGDCLHRILRKMGVPEKAMPAYQRLVEAANPKVHDINLIRPGQVLIFPPPSSAKSTAGGASRTGTSEKPSPSPSLAPAPAISAADSNPPPPSVPAADPVMDAAQLPEQVYIQLGESVQNSGSLYLPILEAGTLTLDSARYPLISLDSGTVLILDARNSVPVSMKDLIEKTLPKYRLVRLGDAASPEEILDRLLRQSNYSAVSRSKGLVLEGDVTVSLNCDWLIEKTPDAILGDSLYAINYARYPREIIPRAVRDIAGRHNIRIVNIPESMEENSLSESSQDPSPAAESIHGDTQAELLTRLLTRLGLPYLSDIDLTLYVEEGGGVTMTYKADILVEGARRLVLAFHEIPPSLAGLMDAQEIDHATILPNLSPLQTIVAVLNALRVKQTSPQVVFKEQGIEGKDKFTISVPGVFLTFAGESLLFTGRAPEEQILAFLAGQGVKVIVY